MTSPRPDFLETLRQMAQKPDATRTPDPKGSFDDLMRQLTGGGTVSNRYEGLRPAIPVVQSAMPDYISGPAGAEGAAAKLAAEVPAGQPGMLGALERLVAPQQEPLTQAAKGYNGPWAKASDNLMGFPQDGGRAKQFADQAYRHEQGVRITWPNGTVHEDVVRGLNQPHALARAWRNWSDASKIEAIPISQVPNPRDTFAGFDKKDVAARIQKQHSVDPGQQEAFIPQEQVPTGTGHLEHLQSALAGTRKDFSNDWRSTLLNSTGQDARAAALGLGADQSLPGSGFFRNPLSGKIETNPTSVARPMVNLDRAEGRGAVIAPPDERLMRGIAADQAYVDGQAAYAGGTPIHGNASGRSTSIFAPNNGALTDSEMSGLTNRFEPEGFTAIDTGKGVNLLQPGPEGYSPGPIMPGSVLQKMLTKGNPKGAQGARGPWSADLQGIVNKSGKADVADWNGFYSPMHTTNPSEFGNGQATDHLREVLTDDMVRRFDKDPFVGLQPMQRSLRDADYAAQGFGAQRPDIERARDILANGWGGMPPGRAALFAARKAGVALPLLGAGYLGDLFTKQQPQEP